MAAITADIKQGATVIRDFGWDKEKMTDGFKVVTKRLDAHAGTISAVAEDVTEMKDTLQDHSQQLGRIETKLDSTIARVDDHSVRINRLEKAREH